MVVNYAGKAAPAQSLVADIKAAGGQGIAVQADVAIAADVERLFKESMEAFGRPDVVVHCAGIMALFPIAGGDVATFDKSTITRRTCAGRSWYSLRQRSMLRMGGASWLSRFQQRSGWQGFPDLRRLHRFQVGSRRVGPRACERTARQKHHGECGGTGPGANGAVLEGQERRTDRRSCGR